MYEYEHTYLLLLYLNVRSIPTKKEARKMDPLTNIFKLLSDETRLRILILLYQEELCVCQLSGVLGVPQPRISQNLSKFRDTGLVTDERKEKYVFYSLKRENKILMDILNDIMNNIEAYSRLIEDRRGLIHKEDYLTQCCNVCK